MTVPVPGVNFSVSTFDSALKTLFIQQPGLLDMRNYNHPLLDRLNVVDGFLGGKETEVLRLNTTGGGYGFGSPTLMPRLQSAEGIRPKISAKYFYVREGVTREFISRTKREQESFVKAVDHILSQMKRQERQGLALAAIYGDINGDLELAVIASSGVTDNGSGNYDIILSGAMESQFHANMIINIGTGDSDPFRVVSVSEAAVTKVVTLNVLRLDGSQVPADADEVYLQNSEGTSFTGLAAVAATSGTLYNVAISAGARWAARVVDMLGAAIDEKKLNEELIRSANYSGEEPNLILCGLDQYLMIQNFVMSKRDLKKDDKIGMSGALTIDGPMGAVEVIWDQHVPRDVIWLLNTKRMSLVRMPMAGIIENAAGGVLHSEHAVDKDSYLIQSALYGEFFFEPTHQTKLHSLALA